MQKTMLAIAACLIALGLGSLLSGCAAEPDSEPPITGACYRAFGPTLEAWDRAWQEAYGERTPEDCRYLDQEYEIDMVSHSENLPCNNEPLSANQLVTGCIQPTQRVISIRARDDLGMVDTAIHEWIHALADCVIGDYDYGHFRAGLWAASGPKSVEIQAAANVVIGECL